MKGKKSKHLSYDKWKKGMSVIIATIEVTTK